MVLTHLNGRTINKYHVVNLWAIIVLFTVQRVTVFALGQILDMLPPCTFNDCDTLTQWVLWVYRFMAGN